VSLEDFPEFDRAVRLHLDQAADALVAEFAGIYPEDHVRAVVEESAAQLFHGNVAAYVPILAKRFARERLEAQARAEGKIARDVTEILFVSLTGSGRAQMAAALLSRDTGDSVRAHTAGSHAATELDPAVVAVMEEAGIDMSETFTRPLTPEVLAGADVVVTMGRSVGAVEIPESARHVDWRVGDPAGADVDEARRVREDIERRVEALVAELASQR
jgi:protein-tyrosine-phosphatase